MAGKLSRVSFNEYMPLRDIVFNSLREAIIVGELKPGERLMEVQLAEKMGVSRTPVREAIRMLELEGLVKMHPRKGAFVAELTAKDIINVLEIRGTLDGLATSLATERITDEEIEELKKVQKEFINYIEKGDLQGSIEKDVEFHAIIYKAARNEKLIQIAGNLWEQVQRFRVVYIKDFSNAEDLIREHNEILEAISERNPEKAQNYAKNHVKVQEEKIIAAITKLEQQ